jgi:hypothetical protein
MLSTLYHVLWLVLAGIAASSAVLSGISLHLWLSPSNQLAAHNNIPNDFRVVSWLQSVKTLSVDAGLLSLFYLAHTFLSRLPQPLGRSFYVAGTALCVEVRDVVPTC